MSNLSTILRGKDITVLEDNAQWKNRFKIKSESSNRIYIVAQNKASGTWGCSCPGWKRHRNCKHLSTLNPLLSQVK